MYNERKEQHGKFQKEPDHIRHQQILEQSLIWAKKLGLVTSFLWSFGAFATLMPRYRSRWAGLVRSSVSIRYFLIGVLFLSRITHDAHAHPVLPRFLFQARIFSLNIGHLIVWQSQKLYMRAEIKSVSPTHHHFAIRWLYRRTKKKRTWTEFLVNNRFQIKFWISKIRKSEFPIALFIFPSVLCDALFSDYSHLRLIQNRMLTTISTLIRYSVLSEVTSHSHP